MFCLFWCQLDDGAVLYNIWPGGVKIHNGQIEFTEEFGNGDLRDYHEGRLRELFDC